MRIVTLDALICDLEVAKNVAEQAGLEATEVEVAIVVNNTYKTFERLSFDVFEAEPKITLIYR